MKIGRTLLKWTREKGKMVDANGKDASAKIAAAEALLKEYRTLSGRVRGGKASTLKKREAAKRREANKRAQK